MLLAVDPGLRRCGVAVFGYDRKLMMAAAVQADPPDMRNAAAWEAMTRRVVSGVDREIQAVAIEFPRVYQGGKQKGDPADLLELAAVVGSIAYAMRERVVSRYFPRDWKGQMDKATCHARIKERLSPEETRRVTTADHNAWDAIGIGLFHLGRFERKRVFAR